MAQTELVINDIPVYKATNTRTPVVLGDTVTVVLRSDNNAYATKDVVLTHVDHIRKQYGWDRELVDVRSLDVKRFHSKHQPLCPGGVIGGSLFGAPDEQDEPDQQDKQETRKERKEREEREEDEEEERSKENHSRKRHAAAT